MCVQTTCLGMIGFIERNDDLHPCAIIFSIKKIPKIFYYIDFFL